MLSVQAQDTSDLTPTTTPALLPSTSQTITKVISTRASPVNDDNLTTTSKGIVDTSDGISVKHKEPVNEDNENKPAIELYVNKTNNKNETEVPSDTKVGEKSISENSSESTTTERELAKPNSKTFNDKTEEADSNDTIDKFDADDVNTNSSTVGSNVDDQSTSVSTAGTDNSDSSTSHATQEPAGKCTIQVMKFKVTS